MDTPAIKYTSVELHRNNVVVLKNINLTVNPGELVYLVGKVGSGKSSFLKSLYSEIPVMKGKAEVLGYDLVDLKKKDIPFLRRQIGIVFQDFRLLPDRSVYENLMFVLNATGWKNRLQKEERIRQVLLSVGMSNKSYKMPHELSGGEQQRVVMARAMLNNPKLLLADEPTGNLDPTTGKQIMQMLVDAASAGAAVVVATHNLSLVDQFPARMIRCADKHLSE